MGLPRKLSIVVTQLAQGDLRVETEKLVEVAVQDEIGDLTRNLHNMKQQFGNLVKQVSTSFLNT